MSENQKPELFAPMDEDSCEISEFLSPASFWFPDALVESAWHQHAPFGFWLIEALKPRTVVELGTHRGFSYLVFCQAVQKLQLETKCYAVDTWKGDEHAGFYDEDVYESLSAYHDPRYRSFSRLMRSTFDEALAHFPERAVDLLHIDGRHFYEDVKHDFETWKEKLSDRAIVIFHDTNVRERGFGVFQLWTELKAQYPGFEFFHGHGLGVLGVGDNLPERLKDLFEASSRRSADSQIRDVYARLGMAVEDRFRRDADSQALRAMRARAERSERDATRERRRAQALVARRMQARRSARRANRAAAEHRAKSQALESELESHRQQLRSLENTAGERDARIRELEQMLAAERATHGELDRKSRSSRWLFRRLAGKLAHAPRDISRRLRRSGRKKREARLTGKRLFNKRYRKYASSRLILRSEPILPRRFAERMRRRMAKHAPAAARNGQIDNASAKMDALFEQLFRAAQPPGDEHVTLSEYGLTEGSRIKAIAFYLPQFHPIPENDEWWGKGFTEWTNVSKATPQFVGHYQPRLPGELGFYDLRVPEVMKRQIELAKHYGIYGFCFHYYWFTGRKRLLERPLNQFLANRDEFDFPFCICWANENWTRRWDGLDQEILMEQRHEPQDDLEFIEDLAPILRDPRYIRVNGRPLIIVYRVNILPNAPRTVEVWRDYCRANGIGNPWLVAAQSFGIGDPRPYGFDAAVEFPPHNLHPQLINNLHFFNPEFDGRVYDYKDVVEHISSFKWPEYNLYKTIIPSWDNEARKPGKGNVLAGSTPDLYRRWLAAICRATDERYTSRDEKLVFINAWNEWGEGAYLEPDRRYGYAYLQETQEVLAQFTKDERLNSGNKIACSKRIASACSEKAVILHLFYPDLWNELASYIRNINNCFDIYISVPNHTERIVYQMILEDFPQANIVELPNRGRDIGPFIELLRKIDDMNYKCVCKIHSKKSVHRGDGHKWREDIIGPLLGSPSCCDAIVDFFRQNDDVGLVGPTDHFISFQAYTHDKTMQSVYRLMERLGLARLPDDDFSFFAGSMFWFRPAALRLLLDNLSQAEFDEEVGQVDGTLAHAMERLFPLICDQCGFRVTTTEEAGCHGSSKARVPSTIKKPKDRYPFAISVNHNMRT